MARLESADLDGGNQRVLHTVRDASLYNLVVDGMSGKIYWVTFDHVTRHEEPKVCGFGWRKPEGASHSSGCLTIQPCR